MPAALLLVLLLSAPGSCQNSGEVRFHIILNATEGHRMEDGDVTVQAMISDDVWDPKVQDLGSHHFNDVVSFTPLKPWALGDRFHVVMVHHNLFTVEKAEGTLKLLHLIGGTDADPYEAHMRQDASFAINWMTVAGVVAVAGLVLGAGLALRLRRKPQPSTTYENIETIAGLATSWDPESRNLLPPDLRIGQYLVVGKLGAGGMAAVYKATDTEGHFYALKIPNPDALSREDTRTRFEREISICATLIHPNIVRTFDYGTFESKLTVPYLVMELVSGGELDEMLEVRVRSGSPPDIPFALQVMEGLLSGLAFAHDKGIIHRDIKPSNLMMTPAGVKIMDFGIAHMTMMKTLTATGMIVGTPSHMAPEQVASADDLDTRADIYAAGVILYQMITHKLPYPQKTNDPMGILLRKLEGPPPPPHSLNPNISLELNDLAMHMLAVDRTERCPSAQDALNRLRSRSHHTGA